MEKADVIDESTKSIASVEEATKDPVTPSTNFMFDNLQAIDAANDIDKLGNDDDLSFGSSSQASSVTATSLRIELDPQEGTQVNNICCAEEGGFPAPSFGDSEVDAFGSTSKIEEFSKQQHIVSEAAPDSQLEERPAVADTKDQDESLPIHSEDLEDEGFIDLGPFEQPPIGSLNTNRGSIDTEIDSMQKCIVTVEPEVLDVEDEPIATIIESDQFDKSEAFLVRDDFDDSEESPAAELEVAEVVEIEEDQVATYNAESTAVIASADDDYDAFEEAPVAEEPDVKIIDEGEEHNSEFEAPFRSVTDAASSTNEEMFDAFEEAPAVEEEAGVKIIDEAQVDNAEAITVSAGEEDDANEGLSDDYDVFEDAPAMEEDVDVKVVEKDQIDVAEAVTANEDVFDAFEEAPVVEEEPNPMALEEERPDPAEAVPVSADDEDSGHKDVIDEFDTFEEAPAAESDIDVNIMDEQNDDESEAIVLPVTKDARSAEEEAGVEIIDKAASADEEDDAIEDSFEDAFEQAPTVEGEANDQIDAAEAIIASVGEEDDTNDESFSDFDAFEQAPVSEDKSDVKVLDEDQVDNTEAIIASEGDEDDDDTNEGSFDDFDAFEAAPVVEEEADAAILEEHQVDAAVAIIASVDDEDVGNEDAFGDFDALEEAPDAEEQIDSNIRNEVQDDEHDNDESEVIVSPIKDVSDEGNEDSFDDFCDFDDFEEAPPTEEGLNSVSADETQVKEKNDIPESASSDDDSDFGDFEDIQEVTTQLDVADENSDSVFVQKAAALLSDLFQDGVIPNKTVENALDISTVRIIDVMPTLPCYTSETGVLQEARRVHLQNLFDHTTTKDNPSNVFVNECCQLWRQEFADVDYSVGKSIEDDSLYDVLDLDLPTLDEVVDAEVLPSSNGGVGTEISSRSGSFDSDFGDFHETANSNEDVAVETSACNIQDEGITSVSNDSFGSDFGDFHKTANTETLDTNSHEPGATIVKIPQKKSSGANKVYSDVAITDSNGVDVNDNVANRGDIFAAFDNDFNTIGGGLDKSSKEKSNVLFPPIPSFASKSDGYGNSTTANYSGSNLSGQVENELSDPFGSTILTAVPVDNIGNFQPAVEVDNSVGASDDSFCSFQDIEEPVGREASGDDTNHESSTLCNDVVSGDCKGSNEMFGTTHDLDGQTNNNNTISHGDFDFEGFRPASNAQLLSDANTNTTSAGSFEMVKSLNKIQVEEEGETVRVPTTHNTFVPSNDDNIQDNDQVHIKNVNFTRSSHPEPDPEHSERGEDISVNDIVNTTSSSDDFGDFEAPEIHDNVAAMGISQPEASLNASESSLSSAPLSFGEIPPNAPDPPMPSFAPPSIPCFGIQDNEGIDGSVAVGLGAIQNTSEGEIAEDLQPTGDFGFNASAAQSAGANRPSHFSSESSTSPPPVLPSFPFSAALDFTDNCKVGMDMPPDALSGMECEDDEFTDFNEAQDLDGQTNNDFDFKGFKPASNGCSYPERDENANGNDIAITTCSSDDFGDFEAPEMNIPPIGSTPEAPSYSTYFLDTNIDAAKSNLSLVPESAGVPDANSGSISVGFQNTQVIDNNIDMTFDSSKTANDFGFNNSNSVQPARQGQPLNLEPSMSVFRETNMQPASQPLTLPTHAAPMHQNLDPFAHLDSLSSPPALGAHVDPLSSSTAHESSESSTFSAATISHGVSNEANSIYAMPSAVNNSENNLVSEVLPYSNSNSYMSTTINPPVVQSEASQPNDPANASMYGSSGNAITDAFSVFD